MRVALFSDIHSNYHALEAVLADLTQRGADRLICLGDLTVKGPLPKQCVDRVRDLGCPVVRGNTDGCYHPDFYPSRFAPRNQSQVVAIADFDRHLAALSEADQTWLQEFPLTHSEVLDGVRMDFFHAVPHHNYVLTMPWASNEELAELKLSDDTRVSAFGHCHRPFVRHVGGLAIVNTGSVGIPFDGDPRPSYAIVEIAGRVTSAQIVRVPYDAEAAIKVAQDVGMKGWELFARTARTGRFPG